MRNLLVTPSFSLTFRCTQRQAPAPSSDPAKATLLASPQWPPLPCHTPDNDGEPGHNPTTPTCKKGPSRLVSTLPSTEQTDEGVPGTQRAPRTTLCSALLRRPTPRHAHSAVRRIHERHKRREQQCTRPPARQRTRAHSAPLLQHIPAGPAAQDSLLQTGRRRDTLPHPPQLAERVNTPPLALHATRPTRSAPRDPARDPRVRRASLANAPPATCTLNGQGADIARGARNAYAWQRRVQTTQRESARPRLTAGARSFGGPTTGRGLRRGAAGTSWDGGDGLGTAPRGSANMGYGTSTRRLHGRT